MGKITLQGGQLHLEQNDREHFEAQLKAAYAISDVSRRNEVVAQMVYPIIRKVAPYLEWTQYFFVGKDGSPYDGIRFPVDEYTAVAVMSSPDGEPFYTRPWRKYQTTDFHTIKCGIELPWDADRWGWDVVGTKMLEAAEEMARRRDEYRQPLLDAAAISQAGHIPTVATTLSKASVDNIIQTSTRLGFPVTQVAVNAGRIMDQTSWTLPANSMVGGSMPTDIGNDIFTQLYSNGYGRLRWIMNHTIPWGYMYFSGPVSNIGWFISDGGTRAASESDIDRDLDKHNWRQSIAAKIMGPQWVWRLQIT